MPTPLTPKSIHIFVFPGSGFNSTDFTYSASIIDSRSMIFSCSEIFSSRQIASSFSVNSKDVFTPTSPSIKASVKSSKNSLLIDVWDEKRDFIFCAKESLAIIFLKCMKAYFFHKIQITLKACNAVTFPHHFFVRFFLAGFSGFTFSGNASLAECRYLTSS